MLCYRPTFLFTLRLLLVYAVSITDTVFEAMPPVEAWLSFAQTLVHHVAMSSLEFRQHLLRAACMPPPPRTLGFCVPLLFLRSKHALVGTVHKQVGTIALSSVTHFSSQPVDICIL